MKVHFAAGDRTRCGKPGLPMSAAEADVTCDRCLGLLHGTHERGWRWADVRPCGTPAAYRRHLRRGEKACEACRQAEARKAADRDARKRRERNAAAYGRAA